jgi:hypothetical protein
MREKWHKATGMIVESPDNPPGAVGPTFHADPEIHAYVVEVVTPHGPRRAGMSEFSRFVHEVGALMHVEIGSKSGEVKVDHDAMTKVAVQLMQDRPEARPGYARYQSGGPAAGGPGQQGGSLLMPPQPGQARDR